MDNDSLFQFSNSLALLSWILLIVFPKWKWTSRLILGVSVSALGLLYAASIFNAMNPEDMQSFGSLQGLMVLFQNEQAVLAGWIHYLAFDLMCGLYITYNGLKNGLPKLVLLPSQIFCFMLGPVGLLLYFISRSIRTKQYFHNYQS